MPLQYHPAMLERCILDLMYAEGMIIMILLVIFKHRRGLMFNPQVGIMTISRD